MFGRKKQEVTPTQSLVPFYKAEITRLEGKLAYMLAEAEALADLRHMEWKVRKAERRHTWLLHGVTIPETTHDIEMGKMFEEMERRMQEEAEASLQRLEERREAERGHDMEMQRIEAQKAIGYTLARALENDLTS